MQSYEVEVKSLLGDPQRAEALRVRMREVDPTTKLTSRNKQLNHYFIGGSMLALANLASKLSPRVVTKFNDPTLKSLEGGGTKISVRTRQKDEEVLLVVKGSIGNDSSANGVSRIEIEEKVDLSLAQLDELLLQAGFSYQAKWSREREEYSFKGTNVCLDKNAGYGWLAEFEKVVDSAAEVAPARSFIDELMRECGVQELPQERLERMFAFYNKHWPEYYGTDKLFTVE